MGSAFTLVVSFSKPVTPKVLNEYVDYVTLVNCVHVLSASDRKIELLVDQRKPDMLERVVERIRQLRTDMEIGSVLTRNPGEYFVMMSDTKGLKVDLSGSADAARRAFGI